MFNEKSIKWQKKVIGGLSKKYIVKNDKNKKNYWVVLSSNEENKKKQL